METFLRNATFEVEHTLTYKDTGLPIDLDLCTEITIVYKHWKTNAILVTKKLSTGGVVKKIAASGICSVYINLAENVTPEKGMYNWYVTPEYVDTNYTDDLASPVGYGNAFEIK